MATNAKYPGLLGINELQNNIIQLESIFSKIKHKTNEEIRTHTKFFNDWDKFYDQFIGQAELIPESTMKSLNDKYNQEVRIIDQIAKRSLETEKQIRTKKAAVQTREEQLKRQAAIEEEDRLRYEREQQLRQQEAIEQAEEEKYKRQQLASQILDETEPQKQPISVVKAQEFGTSTWQQLANSWDALQNLWDRIKTVDRNVQETVNNSLMKWQDFYYSEIEQWFMMEKPVPARYDPELTKWRKLYGKTKNVVETAAAQSVVLSEPEKFGEIPQERIKHGYVDPKTGMIIPAEEFITGMVQKQPTAPPVPAQVLPGADKPWLPPPMIPPPEPPYKPPPTIVIKQCYPPVQPTEPSIDPDEPMIFEPGIRGLGDIPPGGGLVEPRIEDEDDPFEIYTEKAKSTWPWLVGLGTVIFLAKAWRKG